MRALFAGSFDPVTNGHLDLIRRLAGLVESLVVAVAINQHKRPLFTADERVALLVELCHPWSNVQVQAFSGLIVDAARATGVDCIVRGIRSDGEFAHEMQMALANRALAGIETLLLPASPDLSFISSSLVKEVASFGGDVTPFVPVVVAERLQARLVR
jgi:pantetheine-phosphate adenylyltransferase